MNRSYYSNDFTSFLAHDSSTILGMLVSNSPFAVETQQRDAWQYQITLLQSIVSESQFSGTMHFEFTVPRLGKRIDVVVVMGGVIFVLEFKVGESSYSAIARDQVWDYALDLKNFHETSRDQVLVPVLVATDGPSVEYDSIPMDDDLLARPLNCNSKTLPSILQQGLSLSKTPDGVPSMWERGRYSPTPTIIEAAMALYKGHNVVDISRSDASAINLTETSEEVAGIIERSRQNRQKSICFVTGVPGAGKTLVGLNIATKNIDQQNDSHSVFLSGNGPLVSVLREALTRDKVLTAKAQGQKLLKGKVRSEVQLFIQNIHHFRDDCLADVNPPVEHVVLFDEAQRAWNREQTVNFMRRKKGNASFDLSEPEFLISCMDRHQDWAVIVCLVGGGQEINTGEAGISEWIESINRSYPNWAVYISDRLTESEYGAGEIVAAMQKRPKVEFHPKLHLAVSMRSFRAERVSLLVKQLLDLEAGQAASTYQDVSSRYPIMITRNLDHAKRWLKDRARGNERYGLVASSQAQRLKPHAIDIRAPLDPIHWFLDPKTDVRSSYYLEDAVTEFHVQGLELDWACVNWDADLRYENSRWEYRSFVGDRWNRINKGTRKQYLLNAYRVLLTRARQGMVIFVPPGDVADPTLNPNYYDGTFNYLRSIGIRELPG